MDKDHSAQTSTATLPGLEESSAIDARLNQRLFVLDPERYDAFIQILDHPPAPGPKLRALLRRRPAWER
jgi:uncharacterized protein (DUF1778 family)